MDWFQVLGVIVGVGGLNWVILGWFRTDMKSFESEVKADLKSFENEVRGWRQDLNKEMKDFHGRLCTIEEKRKGK